MAGPVNPCRPKPGQKSDRNCGNTIKAPFNLQTALVLLGDVLLKGAENFLLANPLNLEKGMPLAYTALGVYSTALDDKNKDATQQWQNKDTIEDRIEKANILIKQRVSVASYWKTQSGIRPYQCASCHSGNNSFVQANSYNILNFHPLFVVMRN